jgi:hypothetical protein
MPRAAPDREVKAWVAELAARGVDPRRVAVKIEVTTTTTRSFTVIPDAERQSQTETESETPRWPQNADPR